MQHKDKEEPSDTRTFAPGIVREQRLFVLSFRDDSLNYFCMSCICNRILLLLLLLRLLMLLSALASCLVIM